MTQFPSLSLSTWWEVLQNLNLNGRPASQPQILDDPTPHAPLRSWQSRPCASSSMSSTPSELSQASTKVACHASDRQTSKSGEARPVAQAATAQDVLLFLISFRLLNALAIQTFFQPDEYFQSLEPAWELAFGPSSGAWITWVSNGH